MATPIGYTLGALLCGSLPDLTSAAIRSIITSDTSTSNNNFLSDINPTADNFVSSIFNTQFVRDTTSTFSSSSGVYLSASSTLFSNITSTYFTGNAFYIYNYIDTGSASTSNLISYSYSSSTIQGPTYFRVNNNKIAFFTDTADNTRFTYRYFNELLMRGLIGNLNNGTVGVALLSNTYPRNINHTSYTDISAYVIAEGTTRTYVNADSSSAYLRPLSTFTPLSATVTGAGGSIVLFLSADSPPANRALICALSGSQINYNTTQDQLVYFRPYLNILMYIN